MESKKKKRDATKIATSATRIVLLDLVGNELTELVGFSVTLFAVNPIDF